MGPDREGAGFVVGRRREIRVLRFRDPGRVCFEVQVVVVVYTFPLLRVRISKRMNRARGNLVSGRPQDGIYKARRKSQDRS